MDAWDLAFVSAMALLGSVALAFGFLTGWRTPYALSRVDEPMTVAPDPWCGYTIEQKLARRRFYGDVLTACPDARLIEREPRIRMRLTWPAAQWTRT
jgi:hypothetical protein